jgi:hypothetical protein
MAEEDGWVDGWMSGWVDGWMDGQFHKRMYKLDKEKKGKNQMVIHSIYSQTFLDT